MNVTTSPRLLKVTLGALMALTLAGHAAAAPPRSNFFPTADELQKLPQWCQGQFRKDLRSDPNSRMPAGCGSFNHLCPAIVALDRAADPTQKPGIRDYNLKVAKKDLAYTRGRVDSGCPMVAELEAAEIRAMNLEMLLKLMPRNRDRQSHAAKSALDNKSLLLGK